MAKLGSDFDLQKDLPDLPIGLDQMNKSMRLYESAGMDYMYEEMGIVDLYFENLTDTQIIFAPDFDAIIYVKNETGWKLVENQFSYPAASQTLWINKDKPAGFVFSFAPNIEKYTKPLTLCVFIFGKMENSDEIVGAYLDIALY